MVTVPSESGQFEPFQRQIIKDKEESIDDLKIYIKVTILGKMEIICSPF